MPNQNFPGVTRWQLKDDCIFVDAYFNKKGDLSKKETRATVDIPCAHVIGNIDKDEREWEVTLLNDVAAFILRFIAMGVDEKYLPDIIASEYGKDLTRQKDRDRINNDIRLVFDQMHTLGYLVARTDAEYPNEPAKKLTPEEIGKQPADLKKKYEFNVRFQSPGPTIIRYRR